MTTINEIQRAVADEWRVSLNEILSRRRAHREHTPRIAAYLLSRDMTRKSLPVIGNSFDKDHTTVLHGIRTAERRMAQCRDFARRVNVVRARLLADREK